MIIEMARIVVLSIVLAATIIAGKVSDTRNTDSVQPAVSTQEATK